MLGAIRSTRATPFDHGTDDDSPSGPFDVFDFGGYGWGRGIANIHFETPAPSLSSGPDIPGVVVKSTSLGSLSGASSLESGDSTLTTGAAGSGLVINVSYDGSVSRAPAGFKTVVGQVVQYFQSHFSDPVTVNINVGYGEVNGSKLGAGALGESNTNLSSVGYSQLTQALAADAKDSTDSSAAASLATNDPTGGHYWVSTAEGKALGLLGPSSDVDGWAGFSSARNVFDYDNSGGVSAGQYDFFGVVAHEFSEIMGRILLVGASVGSSANSYVPLDLFHYSASSIRTFSGSTPGYFSVDNGVTSLNTFNTVAGGDAGDWSGATVDAGNAFASTGVVLPFTHADLTTLDAIGWDTIMPPAPVISSLTVNADDSATLTGNTLAGGTITVFDGANAVGMASANAGGAWIFSTGSNLPDTVHVFTATATDMVGNVSDTAGSAQLGSSSADILSGTPGNDYMDGGAGADTASYALAHAGVTVNLGVSGPQETFGAGIDTLVNIENLTGSAFDDTLIGGTTPYGLSGGAGNDLLSSDAQGDWAGQAYRLYEATLARQPDPGGFDFWIGQLRGGMSLEAAASGFTGSPEFQSTYGSLDDTQFVTLLYNNVLHRAPDPGGLSFWLNQISTGTSRSDVVLGFSESPEGKGNQQAGLQDYVHFVTPSEGNVLDGGAGTDTASYALAHAGVTVNLGVSGPQETFGAGIDTLVNIENLMGSAFADTLIGNGVANVLTGGGGGDMLGGHTPGAVNPTDANTFVYNATSDSAAGAGHYDTVADFVHGLDKIDFSALTGLGNTLVTTNTAPSTVAANTLLVYVAGSDTILYANTSASQQATTSVDMEIHLTGVANLSDSDILHHA